MDNRVGEMQVFLRIVEAGSFSEAARTLRMTPSTVSKLVSRIEERLGVRLVERSTRRLSLTAEGQIYYERSQSVLNDLAEIEYELSQGASAAGGVVRVNISVALGVQALEPILPAFWRAFPNVVVDLSLSDEIVDLYLDRTDIAFRIGPLNSSGLIARRIGATPRKIVASPDYLAARGVPLAIADLVDHNCLGFNFRRSSPVWSVKQAGQVMDQPVTGSLLANNGESVRRAALAGVGLARMGAIHVREDIEAGRLVEVLHDVIEPDEEQIHALFLGGAHMPRRVRAFLDFVTPRMRRFIEGSTEAGPEPA